MPLTKLHYVSRPSDEEHLARLEIGRNKKTNYYHVRVLPSDPGKYPRERGVAFSPDGDSPHTYRTLQKHLSTLPGFGDSFTTCDFLTLSSKVLHVLVASQGHLFTLTVIYYLDILRAPYDLCAKFSPESSGHTLAKALFEAMLKDCTEDEQKGRPKLTGRNFLGSEDHTRINEKKEKA
jgi:hypothetical protein